MKNVILLIPILVLFSCNNPTKKIENIYLNKENILNAFNNISIGERQDSLYFILKCDSIKVFYAFHKSVLNNTDKSQYISNYTDYCSISEEELSNKLELLGNYKIKEVESDFNDIGISLILYLDDINIYYINNPKLVINKNWSDLINRSNKLDDNWYWIEKREYENL